MNTDPTARLRRLGRRMAWLMTAVLWSVPPGVALYVGFFPEQLPFLPWVAAAGFRPRPLSPPGTAAVLTVLELASLPGLWGVWQLKRLFEAYARGDVFSAEAAGRLRRCGYALMLSGATAPAGSVLLSAALSLDLPAGSGSLVVAVSGDDLALLLIGGVTLVIARAMAEAARIADDNAGFV